MPTSAQHILLITGIPGVGKTTLIRRVAQALGECSVAGFYTEEIRETGERRGFRLVTFSGEQGVIAHVEFNHRYAVGKYGVDVAAIGRFAERELAVTKGAELFIVDEIGKMECYAPPFVRAIRVLLDSEALLVATVAQRGGGLIEEVKQRSDCELWEVTHANRDALVTQVLGWLAARR